QAQLADMNGDGKADLIFQGNDNRFWLSESSGAGFATPHLVADQIGNFNFGQAQYADINGDGKADLIYQGADNHFWLSTSTGISFS
ncbi:FG-GAP repeat domain-containing protein, partial [Azospirillum griseum]